MNRIVYAWAGIGYLIAAFLLVLVVWQQKHQKACSETLTRIVTIDRAPAK